MRLIIKACGDELFRKERASGIFTADDLVLIPRNDSSESTQAHAPEKVIKTEDNKVILYKKLAQYCRTYAVKEIIYITETGCILHIRAALAWLAVSIGASFAIVDGNSIKTVRFPLLLLNLLMLPLYPVFSVMLAPWFFFREALGNFAMRKENHEHPFLSFDRSGMLSGVVYWYSFVNRSRRHGIFGYAFNEYMGVPVSLYNFPLSIFLLAKLGFRRLFLCGWLLVAVGLAAMFAISNNNLNWLVISGVVFLFISSNIIWEHASLAVYEIIAWGFCIVGFSLFVNGYYIYAGLLIGLAVMSHLGVVTLILTILSTYAAIHDKLPGLVITGFLSLIISGYWFFPYFSNRNQMTRTRMINEEWDTKYNFSPEGLIQFYVYIGFVISLVVCATFDIVLIAFIATIVTYFNTKIKWLYSPYTVRMFQGLTGIICLALSFNWYSFAFLLYFIFLPPSCISWFGHHDKLFYRFNPDKRLDAVEKADEMFSGLGPGNRIGFECGSRECGFDYRSQYLSAFLSYCLSFTDIEFFNSGMIELLKFDLYKETCAKFNQMSKKEELKQAVLISGVTHMVAFSEAFKDVLESYGYRKIKAIHFKEDFKNTFYDIKAELYAVPFTTTRSLPAAEVSLSRNRLQIYFPKEGSYEIKYSFHPGMLCVQADKTLILSRGDHGMIKIMAKGRGEATLYYSHNKLFTLMLPA